MSKLTEEQLAELERLPSTILHPREQILELIAGYRRAETAEARVKELEAGRAAIVAERIEFEGQSITLRVLLVKAGEATKELLDAHLTHAGDDNWSRIDDDARLRATLSLSAITDALGEKED